MNRREFLCGALAAGTLRPTAVRRGDCLRIAHICDPQFGMTTMRALCKRPDTPDHAAYREDVAYFERVIGRVNALKPDLCLVAGDLCHEAKELERDWPRLIGLFKAPVMVAPGNHDMGNALTAENEDRFIRVFGASYASRDVKGWRIIVGNSQYWKPTGELERKLKYNAWVDAEFARARECAGRVILCAHIPPFVSDFEEPDSHANYPIKGRMRRLERYLEMGSGFFLAGHTHRMAMRGYRELAILNAETTCCNFDGRPRGFRLLEIESKEKYTWKFVQV